MRVAIEQLPAEVDTKRLATLKAQAAIAGYELRTDLLGSATIEHGTRLAAKS